jgi:indolepyruvate ferredoxin oxidoreductase beta subunit
MYNLPLNIIVAGVGGQGNVLCSQLIAWAAIRKGYRAIVGETYGASQRGGPVMSHVRIGKEGLGPLVPSRRAHVLLGFEPVETLRVGTKYLNPESSVIMNTRPIYPAEVLAGYLKYPDVKEVVSAVRGMCKNFWAINAVELAEEAGSPRVMNVVMLGVLAATKLTPFQPEDFKRAINERIGRLKEVNLKAFELGLKAV